MILLICHVISRSHVTKELCALWVGVRNSKLQSFQVWSSEVLSNLRMNAFDLPHDLTWHAIKALHDLLCGGCSGKSTLSVSKLSVLWKFRYNFFDSLRNLTLIMWSKKHVILWVGAFDDSSSPCLVWYP